jgi:DnaK suppressor protein
MKMARKNQQVESPPCTISSVLLKTENGSPKKGCGLEDKDLAYFKKILTEEIEALLQKNVQTVSELKEKEHSCTDPLDMAALHTHQTFTLKIQDRDHQLLRKIRMALERIEDREYGYCERCGEEIGMGRLKARPMARHCMECKMELESQEKVRYYNDSFLGR